MPLMRRKHEYESGPAECRRPRQIGGFPFLPDELPLTVRQAAVYLGVCIQTVYLWVERKQIPPSPRNGPEHPFLGTKVLWMSYPDRHGKRIRESTFTQDWQEADKKLRERLLARDDRLLEIVKKGERIRGDNVELLGCSRQALSGLAFALRAPPALMAVAPLVAFR
jgi:hypothetical protein